MRSEQEIRERLAELRAAVDGCPTCRGKGNHKAQVQKIELLCWVLGDVRLADAD